MSIIQKLKNSKHVKEALMEEKTHYDFISTGCLSLNILFSGKLDGGIPIGKVSTVASPSSLGKSFVGLKLAKNAQTEYGMDVFYVDTEFAYDPSFGDNVGIDREKFLPVQSNQIEEVQQIIASSITELSKEERKNVLLIIDSWGGLVTSKTVNDAVSGKDVTDMTIAKKKNSLARLLTGLGITVFITAQTYETMDMYSPLEIGGGKGVIFASSCIVMGTSKAKSKDGDEINGSIISAKNYKGRFAIENSKLKYLIRYEGGIHPYYGILEDALASGFVIKPSVGWYSRPNVTDDKKWREKEIWDKGKEFWNPIINDPAFKLFIEKKYSFAHNTIFDDVSEIQLTNTETINTETGEVIT